MPRLFRCLAIAALSLALPLVAGAQQGVDAGVRSAERGAGPRAMDRRGPDPRGMDARAGDPRGMDRRDMDPRLARDRAMDRQADPRRALSEAVRRVQRRTGGQILGAELVPFEGRDISRIKYMDERGRVRYMDDPGPGERLRPVPTSPRRDDNDEP